jgi:hypothetical protein
MTIVLNSCQFLPMKSAVPWANILAISLKSVKLAKVAYPVLTDGTHWQSCNAFPPKPTIPVGHIEYFHYIASYNPANLHMIKGLC